MCLFWVSDPEDPAMYDVQSSGGRAGGQPEPPWALHCCSGSKRGPRHGVLEK